MSENHNNSEAVGSVGWLRDRLRGVFAARCEDLQIVATEKQEERFIRTLVERNTSRHGRLVKYFNAQDLSLGPLATMRLSQLLEKLNLHGLNVSNNIMGDEGVKAIHKLIQNSRTLWKLDLSTNGLSAEGFADVAQGLLSSKVKSLNISTHGSGTQNRLGRSGGQAMAASLAAGSFPLLELRMVGVGTVGVNAFMSANPMETNVSLRTLDLRRNAISSESLFGFMQGLMRDPTPFIKTAMGIDVAPRQRAFASPLETLLLSTNNIGDVCLEVPDTEQNSVTRDMHRVNKERLGLEFLLHVMLRKGTSRCPRLRVLDLGYNKLTERFCRWLFAVVPLAFANSDDEFNRLVSERQESSKTATTGGDGWMNLLKALQPSIFQSDHLEELRGVGLEANLEEEKEEERERVESSKRRTNTEMAATHSQTEEETQEESVERGMEGVKVVLDGNALGNGGSEALGRVLGICPLFGSLSLANCNITSVGMLSRGLSVNQNLVNLNLEDNNLGDDGAAMLARALGLRVDRSVADDADYPRSYNSTLKALHLGRNNISDVGASALARMLTHNDTLQVLDLHENEVSDKGAKEFLESLEEITRRNIRTINLARNNISGSLTNLLNATVKAMVHKQRAEMTQRAREEFLELVGVDVEANRAQEKVAVAKFMQAVVNSRQKKRTHEIKELSAEDDLQAMEEELQMLRDRNKEPMKELQKALDRADRELQEYHSRRNLEVRQVEQAISRNQGTRLKAKTELDQMNAKLRIWELDHADMTSQKVEELLAEHAELRKDVSSLSRRLQRSIGQLRSAQCKILEKYRESINGFLETQGAQSHSRYARLNFDVPAFVAWYMKNFTQKSWGERLSLSAPHSSKRSDFGADPPSPRSGSPISSPTHSGDERPKKKSSVSGAAERASTVRALHLLTPKRTSSIAPGSPRSPRESHKLEAPVLPSRASMNSSRRRSSSSRGPVPIRIVLWASEKEYNMPGAFDCPFHLTLSAVSEMANGDIGSLLIKFYPFGPERTLFHRYEGLLPHALPDEQKRHRALQRERKELALLGIARYMQPLVDVAAGQDQGVALLSSIVDFAEIPPSYTLAQVAKALQEQWQLMGLTLTIKDVEGFRIIPSYPHGEYVVDTNANAVGEASQRPHRPSYLLAETALSPLPMSTMQTPKSNKSGSGFRFGTLAVPGDSPVGIGSRSSFIVPKGGLGVILSPADHAVSLDPIATTAAVEDAVQPLKTLQSERRPVNASDLLHLRSGRTNSAKATASPKRTRRPKEAVLPSDESESSDEEARQYVPRVRQRASFHTASEANGGDSTFPHDTVTAFLGYNPIIKGRGSGRTGDTTDYEQSLITEHLHSDGMFHTGEFRLKAASIARNSRKGVVHKPWNQLVQL